MAQRRIEEIDILMGICMIVVALGHSFPTLTSSDVGTPFYYLYRAIHASVLPLFFFLSGVVASRILDCTTAKDKVENVKKRAVRLMVPYFCWGILFIPLKVVFARFARHEFSFSELYTIFLGNNPCGQLWCLYTMFLLSVSAVLFATRKSIKFLLPVTLVIAVFSSFITLRFEGITWMNVAFLSFFYYLGLFISTRVEEFIKSIRLWAFLLSCAVYAVGLCVICAYFRSGFIYGILRLIISLAGICIGFYISKLIYRFAGESKLKAVLSEFGRYSMDIYVLHSPIGVVLRTVLIGVLSFNRLAYSAVYIPVCVVGSYLISRFIVRKIPIFALLFLGIPKKKVDQK